MNFSLPAAAQTNAAAIKPAPLRISIPTAIKNAEAASKIKNHMLLFNIYIWKNFQLYKNSEGYKTAILAQITAINVHFVRRANK